MFGLFRRQPTVEPMAFPPSPPQPKRRPRTLSDPQGEWVESGKPGIRVWSRYPDYVDL